MESFAHANGNFVGYRKENEEKRSGKALASHQYAHLGEIRAQAEGLIGSLTGSPSVHLRLVF